MLIKTYASAVYGINALKITVETHVLAGAKKYLSGLPDNAIKESLQRIESAVKNCGYRMPGRKLIINLAPADIRKEGSAFDLAMAIGVLASSDQITPEQLDQYVIMGELSLDGTLLPVKGALPMAIQARNDGFKGLILPEFNVREAAVVEGLDVYGMKSLTEVISFFAEDKKQEPVKVNVAEEFEKTYTGYPFDFSDVKGQEKQCWPNVFPPFYPH